jgi:hypothetical protein
MIYLGLNTATDFQALVLYAYKGDVSLEHTMYSKKIDDLPDESPELSIQNKRECIRLTFLAIFKAAAIPQ